MSLCMCLVLHFSFFQLRWNVMDFIVLFSPTIRLLKSIYNFSKTQRWAIWLIFNFGKHDKLVVGNREHNGPTKGALSICNEVLTWGNDNPIDDTLLYIFVFTYNEIHNLYKKHRLLSYFVGCVPSNSTIKAMIKEVWESHGWN